MPRLVPGGLLTADNVLSHTEALGPFVNHVFGDRRVDATVIPLGKGVLLARRAKGAGPRGE